AHGASPAASDEPGSSEEAGHVNSADHRMPPVPTERLEILERGLSREIAVVLGLVYVLSLVFSLRTHKHLYTGDSAEKRGEAGHASPGKKNGGRGEGHGTTGIGAAVMMLLVSSVFVGLLAELLVGALEPTAKAMGLTDLFVGVVVVAIVGNAAEHSSAV